MAFSPTKPDFIDGTWRGKIRVWKTPTFASGDTLTVSGLKQVFDVQLANRPAMTYTSSAAANGGTVITFTITASCTGGNTPLLVYGQ